MKERKTIEMARPEMPTIIASTQSVAARRSHAKPQSVFFRRDELDVILSLYGRMVAKGEWRDYAMGGDKTHAHFAVFRRSSEQPLYRIEKWPELARRQGAFVLLGQQGQVLKRGYKLQDVLAQLERRYFKLVEGA